MAKHIWSLRVTAIRQRPAIKYIVTSLKLKLSFLHRTIQNDGGRTSTVRAGPAQIISMD